MKLSEAIELALTSEAYKRASHYMCIALPRMGLGEHVEAVQDMVASIHKDPLQYRDLPLLCALDSAKVIVMENMNQEKQNQYTTEFYVWWVFDLKRKGL